MVAMTKRLTLSDNNNNRDDIYIEWYLHTYNNSTYIIHSLTPSIRHPPNLGYNISNAISNKRTSLYVLNDHIFVKGGNHSLFTLKPRLNITPMYPY